MDDDFEFRKKKIAEGEEQFCATKFDKELLNIPHYRNHEELLPFIGKEFADQPTKILFVGESHYIAGDKYIDGDKYIVENKKVKPVEEEVEKERFNQYCEIKDFWYDENFKEKLTKYCKDYPDNVMNTYTRHGYYYTRGVVHNFISNQNGDSDGIFANPLIAYLGNYGLQNDYDENGNPRKTNKKGEILQRVYQVRGLEEKDIESFKKFAFMNYYQFPTFKKGDSFKWCANDKDKKCAKETLKRVVEILGKEGKLLVVFLSSHAYREFKPVDKEHFKYVTHPCCAWWYRDEGKHGSIKLQEEIFGLPVKRS